MPIRSSNRIDDLYPKSIAFAEGAENVDVAGPLSPKAVIVSDEELAQAKPAAQQELYECFGWICGELRRERQHRDVVDARFRENLELLVVRREQQWSGGRIHDLERVRFERD
jgi:hypothetical protein